MPPFAEALQSSEYYIKWTSCSDLPAKLYDASVAVSADGDTLYVTAGDAPDSSTKTTVYSYNTVTDQWTELPQSGHRFGVISMVDNRLTIFGGTDVITCQYHNKVTTYDRDTNRWYNHYPDMSKIRDRPGVVIYLDYVIVMGGKSSRSTVHSSIELMNYRHNLQWIEISIALPVPMWRIKPTVSGEDLIIVGYGSAKSQSRQSYQIPIQNISPFAIGAVPTGWKKLSPPPYYDSTIIPHSNPPVVIGGGDVSDVLTSDIVVYNPSKNNWRRVGSLTSARDYVGVAMINNYSIIVVGGTGGGQGVKGARVSSLTTVEMGRIATLRNNYTSAYSYVTIDE